MGTPVWVFTSGYAADDVRTDRHGRERGTGCPCGPHDPRTAASTETTTVGRPPSETRAAFFSVTLACAIPRGESSSVGSVQPGASLQGCVLSPRTAIPGPEPAVPLGLCRRCPGPMILGWAHENGLISFKNRKKTKLNFQVKGHVII